MFAITQKYRDLLENRTTYKELSADSPALNSTVKNYMKQGGDIISRIFGADKPYFYYAVGLSVANIVLEDPTPDDLDVVSRITPGIVNLVVGSASETGTNENVQFTIVIQGEKDGK